MARWARRRRAPLAWAVAYLVWVAILVAVLPGVAAAQWPTLSGRASVFGNDPVQGFTDRYDTGFTAMGRPTSGGGIAVYRKSTLGGWWWVCAPLEVVPPMAARCHLVRQTDLGPAPWTRRVLDVTATTARRAWRLAVRSFPTDRGVWTLRYRGHRR